MKRHYFTHRQQTRRILTSALFSLSVLATGGPAAALDGKTLPGAACQPGDQSQSYITDTSGRILNPSTTQNLVVTCPVVRDVITGNSTAGIKQAFVKAIDNNPGTGKEVGCTLASFRGDNGQVVEVTSGTTVGSSPNVQTLPTFVDIASTSGGFYSLRCLIPPRTNSTAPLSGIVMYHIDEQE